MPDDRTYYQQAAAAAWRNHHTYQAEGAKEQAAYWEGMAMAFDLAAARSNRHDRRSTDGHAAP